MEQRTRSEKLQIRWSTFTVILAAQATVTAIFLVTVMDKTSNQLVIEHHGNKAELELC